MGRKTTRFARKLVLVFALLACESALSRLAPKAHAAEIESLALSDCLTQEIRALIIDSDPAAIAQYESRISRRIGAMTIPELENELRAIVETFATKHPGFPRDEFLAWMKKHPVTDDDLSALRHLNPSYGDVLDGRFRLFRLEKETMTEAKSLLPTIKLFASKGDSKLTAKLKSMFPCLDAYRGHISAMASSFAVQVAAYGLMAHNGGEFSYDLLVTNTIFNALLGEKMCREVENMTPAGIAKAKADRAAGIHPVRNAAEMKNQMKNYFFGKINPETGLRPGFARSVLDRQLKYIKYAVPYAALYGVLHAGQGSILHGKKVTFKPLSEIPEKERDQYVSLNPLSLGKDAVVNMLLYDIPFANNRNVFITDPLISIAIPNLLKKTVPIFIVQSGARTASTYYSTKVFRCWEEDKTNIYGCLTKALKDDPTVKAVVVPENLDPAEIERLQKEAARTPAVSTTDAN